MKSCRCGSVEFVTNLNSCGAYCLIDDKLEFQANELIEEKEEVFCRECGKKLRVEL